MKANNPLTPEISATVIHLIRDTDFGSLIFIVQDSKIVQLERHEKYQFPAMAKKMTNRLQVEKSVAVDPLPGIQSSLADLQFGQVVAKIQEGRVVQIERTEKRRLPDLMGLGGDGI
ncbi:MAG: DUF2292 domain-containing protein [Negativicutes bacterium]